MWQVQMVYGTPCVAAASGWVQVDTSPLIHSGCYHVTEGGGLWFERLMLKVVIYDHTDFVELLEVYLLLQR
jgi:hypothetical protein